MQYDPATLGRQELYQLITSIVIPRPIAFVSTVSAAGVPTAAPFSFFNAVSSSPPILAVSVGGSRHGKKTTRLNIEETGEFVVNIVTEEILRPMAVCGEPRMRTVNKIDLAKLTAVPSSAVKPPRIAESPVNLECTLYKMLDIEGATALILGRVVRIHVRNGLLTDGKADAAKVAAIGRLSGTSYCRSKDIIALE